MVKGYKMNDTTYNGWTNYETWSFNLWFDCHFEEDAERIYGDAEPCDIFTKRENAMLELADCIKTFCDDMQAEYSNDSASFFTDILNAAISRVNWHEIAEQYIDDLD